MTLNVISLDQTIDRMIKEYLKKNKKCTRNDALKAIKKAATQDYTNQI